MGTEQEVVIEVKGLYKIYKVGDTKVRALNGVDFQIHKGEFCAIVGASGSGKSTLMQELIYEYAAHKLRKNKPLNTTTLNDLCRILDCRIEDILIYIPSDDDQTL